MPRARTRSVHRGGRSLGLDEPDKLGHRGPAFPHHQKTVLPCRLLSGGGAPTCGGIRAPSLSSFGRIAAIARTVVAGRATPCVSLLTQSQSTRILCRPNAHHRNGRYRTMGGRAAGRKRTNRSTKRAIARQFGSDPALARCPSLASGRQIRPCAADAIDAIDANRVRQAGHSGAGPLGR